MPDNVVERLFLLFAPPDRAEALAGDLAEERADRGWMWYWLHVARLTFVLWRASLVALAPRHGMAACATLAVVGATLLIGFAGPFWATGLSAAIPLLIGSALPRERRS